MTIGEVQRHQLYSMLTAAQKVFVTERCNGKTLEEAAKIAWNCNTDASVRSAANRAARHVNIKFLVDRFYGTTAVPTREELAALAWKKAQNAEDTASAAFIKIAADLLGYRTKPAETPSQAPETAPDDDEEFTLD